MQQLQHKVNKLELKISESQQQSRSDIRKLNQNLQQNTKALKSTISTVQKIIEKLDKFSENNKKHREELRRMQERRKQNGLAYRPAMSTKIKQKDVASQKSKGMIPSMWSAFKCLFRKSPYLHQKLPLVPKTTATIQNEDRTQMRTQQQEQVGLLSQHQQSQSHLLSRQPHGSHLTEEQSGSSNKKQKTHTHFEKKNK